MNSKCLGRLLGWKKSLQFILCCFKKAPRSSIIFSLTCARAKISQIQLTGDPSLAFSKSLHHSIEFSFLMSPCIYFSLHCFLSCFIFQLFILHEQLVPSQHLSIFSVPTWNLIQCLHSKCFCILFLRRSECSFCLFFYILKSSCAIVHLRSFLHFHFFNCIIHSIIQILQIILI